MSEVDDLILISVDDHIIEPPDLFVHHLDAKYLDRAPKLVRNDEGNDVWTFGEVVMETAALNAVAGRPKEEYGLEPQSLDEVRPGCYDVHERVKDMDAGRRPRLHELPLLPHLHGSGLRRATTPISPWRWSGPTTTGTSTSGAVRTRPASSPWRSRSSGTPELTADEIRRVAAKGCHSLSFTENPAALGYPSFHDEYWDPVWRACCDTGTVLAIHLGSSGRLSIPAVDSPPDVMITLQPMNIQSAAADLLWSRVLKNYPDLRVALSEGGTGWIPYFLVAGRPHLRDAPRLDAAGLRRPAPERGVPGALPDLLHQRPGRHRAARATSASTTSPGRPTTRTATPCGPTRPRSSAAEFAKYAVPATATSPR